MKQGFRPHSTKIFQDCVQGLFKDLKELSDTNSTDKQMIIRHLEVLTGIINGIESNELVDDSYYQAILIGIEC